ncbi:hypothetical protein [Zarconia navalis]|uniref:hypothetical protein n=1 Tax=Zarconia navalis TaxID=2992134 RepID=UPI0021F90C70|nr:hypothetical protein [Zarconia navalis]
MEKKQTYVSSAIATGILVAIGTQAIAIPPQKALQLAQVTSVSELSDVQPTD